ncbi:hypothetical protein PT974_08876 [Cladobotryum mycophilum]|uniref:Signal peptide-containing protein n=1 Tax=Cladobotryum mycophilum TaxID=491253 RepID=A0ABR0SEK8_9HYPO
MSFPVAFQSAVFYILACTPCAQVRHRHKVKAEAKKERLEKAKLETEQPGLYRHPSPYNTNPFWQEEITMGPTPGESSVMSISDRTGTAHSQAHFDDSMTAMPEEDMLSDDWNTRHGYQREDEELWGEWSGHKLKDAFSKARDSAGRLIESTLGKEKEVTEEDRRAFYLAPRNPPVNDYHPPVVSSKLPHKGAHKWMLQPPPPAKVMEGKVPVSRAASSASKSSGKTTLVGEDIQLARLVHDKILKEKMLKESFPTEEQLIDSLFVSRTSYSSLHRSRSLSFEASDESIDAPSPFDRPRSKNRLRPLAIPPGFESEDEFEDIFTPRVSKSASQSSKVGRVAQRPKLETIPSSEASTGRSRSKRSRRQMSTRMRRNLASPVGDDSD